MSASAPTRGSLVNGSMPAKIASVSATDMQTMMDANTGPTADLLRSVFTLQCSIDIYRLQYQTVGGQNEPTTASAALMIPTGSGSQCQGARPVAMYAHGTTNDKAYNIADLRNNAEGILIAAAFAARGYIVVAPNYAGYDTSTLTYHPYLNADQQSKDMIDALAAARTSLPMLNQSVTDSGKLFITGYSQGGYVAMATHRALQAAGQTVTASAPMSGPYALAAFGDAIFQGQVTKSGPANVSLIVSSYQKAYGNLYTNLTDIYEAPFAMGDGNLPPDQLFNSTPPDPMFANITPATEPANLAAVFAKGFGPNNLVTNSYRLSALLDAQASPDTPMNPLRQALKRNDLRNWSPNAPTLLCAGNSDPTVLFLNTQLMQSYWTTNPPPGAVTVVDIDSSSTNDDPYGKYKNSFTLAKDIVAATAVIGGAKDGGQAAVLDAYHATLVAPFCLASVASFFDGVGIN